MTPALWLLADSRLPTGGHAHSGGIEAVVRRGLVTGPDDVARFLAARVPTTGLVTAAVAAAACALAGSGTERRAPGSRHGGPGAPSLAAEPAGVAERRAPGSRRGGPGAPSFGAEGIDWAPWDEAVDVRTPVAALREVSRQQGRAMLRTVRAAWPAADVDGLGSRPHQALVLGVATAAAGGTLQDAAGLAVHHLTGQVCSAAVRLLGLDPLALAGVHARTLGEHDVVVTSAAEAGGRAATAADPGLLPSATTPWPEIHAVMHARAEGALFAS